MLYKLCGIFILVVMTALFFQCQHSEKSDEFPLADKFINPEARFKAYSGLSFNLKTTNDSIAGKQIQMYHEEGFGGVFIEAVQ